MIQSADISKCCTETQPKTASNAGVEASWLGKTQLFSLNIVSNVKLTYIYVWDHYIII